MKTIFSAFWRAAAYCLHPRVIALSILPLLIMGGLALALWFLFGDLALKLIHDSLLGGQWLTQILAWFDTVGLGSLKSVIAPLILVIMATPLIVMGSLLMVAFFMTPAMVSLVSERRFEALERKKGASTWGAVAWSFGAVVVAALILLVSIPLWFIPPLVMIIPPLIWGWLTYRVMAFDALALHASKEERRQIFKTHRMPLLCIGVVCGYLGAAPTVIWAGGVLTLVLAPVFMVVAIWIYTLVFAFSSLWFAHFCLKALADLRNDGNANEKIPRTHPLLGSKSLKPPAEIAQTATENIAHLTSLSNPESNSRSAP